MIILKLFFLFCYFGCLSFGGGQSLTPIYIDKLVNTWHWMTLEEFGNLVAISQMTPGPIAVNSATFFGYRQGGIAGGLAATIGLLTPSYFLVIFALRSLDRWENSRIVQGIMTGIRPATIGMIAAALLIFMQMSVFSEDIPFVPALQWLAGRREVFSGHFFIRPGALLIFILATWLLYRNKAGIMTTIFASAAAGMLLCR